MKIRTERVLATYTSTFYIHIAVESHHSSVFSLLFCSNSTSSWTLVHGGFVFDLSSRHINCHHVQGSIDCVLYCAVLFFCK